MVVGVTGLVSRRQDSSADDWDLDQKETIVRGAGYLYIEGNVEKGAVIAKTLLWIILIDNDRALLNVSCDIYTSSSTNKITAKR
jgi:hypothetical protein